MPPGKALVVGSAGRNWDLEVVAMFQGTTIDELFDAVVRAERHARSAGVAAALPVEEPTVELMPGFLYEMAQANAELVGVA